MPCIVKDTLVNIITFFRNVCRIHISKEKVHFGIVEGVEALEDRFRICKGFNKNHLQRLVLGIDVLLVANVQVLDVYDAEGKVSMPFLYVGIIRIIIDFVIDKEGYNIENLAVNVFIKV